MNPAEPNPPAPLPPHDTGKQPSAAEVAGALRRMAEEQRAVLAAAAALDDAPGLDQVERTLAKAMNRRAPPARRRRSVRLALAAAIGLAAALTFFRTDSDHQSGPGPGQRLGRESFRILDPAPGELPYQGVAWTDPAVAGGTFDVLVTSAADASDELLERRALLGPELRFSPDETAKWPDAIVISVTLRDAAGAALDAARVSRSRSPP